MRNRSTMDHQIESPRSAFSSNVGSELPKELAAQDRRILKGDQIAGQALVVFAKLHPN